MTKITIDRATVEQALEALDSDNPDIQFRAAIILRAALAEPVQEPVAWNWMQDEAPCSPAYFGTPPDLVAAAEREACAALAEKTICDTHIPTGVKIYGFRAAAAIRARGKT